MQWKYYIVIDVVVWNCDLPFVTCPSWYGVRPALRGLEFRPALRGMELDLPFVDVAVASWMFADGSIDWSSRFCIPKLYLYNEVVEQQARAFILRVIGGFFMLSGPRVHLMYIHLLDDLSHTFQYTIIKEQNEIWGCLLLLQSWAYDHIPILTPRLYDNTIQFYSFFNFSNELIERTYAPQSYNNFIQTIDYVHSTCQDLVKALRELNSTALKISSPRAPPTQHFNMPAYEFESEHQSSCQVEVHMFGNHKSKDT
ncbi:hypothetical protein Lal_00037341 [Lupinus albus]|nr:hypothetical protein Lal_00037341 [Lupinus albus]